MGVSEERFWKLNPRTIKPYVKAYEIRANNKDTEMWQMGLYFHQALSSVMAALAASFGNKKSNVKYFEEPLHVTSEKQSVTNVDLTEEEKIQQTKLLFERLKTMQANFNANKKNNKTE